jgi:hypothetical protein
MHKLIHKICGKIEFGKCANSGLCAAIFSGSIEIFNKIIGLVLFEWLAHNLIHKICVEISVCGYVTCCYCNFSVEKHEKPMLPK